MSANIAITGVPTTPGSNGKLLFGCPAYYTRAASICRCLLI